MVVAAALSLNSELEATYDALATLQQVHTEFLQLHKDFEHKLDTRKVHSFEEIGSLAVER